MPRRKTTTDQDTAQTNETNEMPAEPLQATAATEESVAKPIKEKGERLTGDALMDLIRANKDQPVDEVIYKAGYYTRTTFPETGESKVTLHKIQFHEAMAYASNPGLTLAPAKRTYAARQGRKPVITVVSNGNAVVGSRHTLVAGFAPGSKVKIEAEEGRIVLTPWIEADIESDDMDL
jgi:hypothetical protein